MAPNKKDHSNDPRSLVIKHYRTEDSQREISTKVLLSRETIRYIIRKYKETKLISNLFGNGRTRKITVAMDRLIVYKIKSNRHLSAHNVKAEIEYELRISLNANTIRNRTHEAGLFGRVARKKTINQHGQSEKAVEVRERHAEQTSWILRNRNLVRRIEVQPFRVRRKNNDMAANVQERVRFQMHSTSS